MAFVTWHYEIDTLPHLTPGDDPELVDLHLPIGVWPDPPQAFNVVVEVWIDDQPPFRIGFDETNPFGSVRGLTSDNIAALRLRDRKAARWYLEMDEKLQATTNQYYEARVKGVPRGATIRYTLKIIPLYQVSQTVGPFTIQVVAPSFTHDDIFAIADNNGANDDAYALYYREDDDYHYFRADLMQVATSRLDFDLVVGGRRYNLTAQPFLPQQLPSLPWINPFADQVTLGVPKQEIAQVTTVQWRGRPYDVQSRVNVGRARLMFIHYCMQGLNDLFELPNKNYNPPRSFIQTTMRDEKATYSSRPNSDEGLIGDGYLFTLDSHRASGVPYLWTFNGGVLALIAHDCPDDIKRIKQDIDAGLMDPTIAGFGGHRLPYYQEETNLSSIQYGIDIVRNILGRCNDVYYLDQRLYKQIPNVIDALNKADRISYVVVDGSTGFFPYAASASPNANGRGIFLDDHYLWKDLQSGLHLLFITDELRERILGSSDWEMARGKLAHALKRKFFHFAANPEARRGHLMIYSDDADKASGNGWFDGDYSGFEIRYKDKFDAALEWIASHPWIEAITSKDLDPDVDCVGTIDMKTAVCPSVDPGGASSWDVYGKQIHFDAWYDNWKTFRSDWLDQTMEEISQAVEYAIIDWPDTYRNRLYDLGRMAFTMYLHESQSNKQPLESLWGLNANQRWDVREPEDFVLAATLQHRNAQVYLNAAVWAEWALGSSSSGSRSDGFLNQGPVLERLEEIRYRNFDWRPQRYRAAPILDHPLRWDRDVMQNAILYNRDVLVVMDQNGGRITHLFAITDGKPRCLSGTFKCYQFLSGEKIAGENVTCDGEVLHNTVYTPNHAYLACDWRQSQGAIGKKYNPKTGVERELDCYYPDNFNSYAFTTLGQVARWTYEQTEPAPAFTLDLFRQLLARDRQEKLRGEPGVIFHPFSSFAKEIALDGRRLEIRYTGTEPDHIVANEFCIDLNDSTLRGTRNQRRTVDGEVVELSNGNGVGVRLELLDNCSFSPATIGSARDFRLQRVMTDCLEVITPGGDFAYRIAV